MLKSFVGGATNSANSKMPIDFTRSASRQLNAPPISTKNGFQSTAGYDTKGLPGDLTTTLGAYRQGNGGAIAEGQIFPDQPVYHATGVAVMFNNIGNNTFQPDNNDTATHALLHRLGDQRFKAEWNLKHENYFQQQKLQQEILDIERTASGSEMNLVSEIMRNVVATRRQQNEDDYMRRAMDSGMSRADAEEELLLAKKNHAKHEANAMPDRSYQHKLLLTRIAASKGVSANISAPLNHSENIMNHTGSEAMAQARGEPGTGFGSGGLDLARKFMTPEFYKRFLKRSAMTTEQADRQTALSQVFSEQPDNDEALTSFATMSGLERQDAIDNARDNVAAKLEMLRNRGSRLMGIVPAFTVFPQIVRGLLSGKQPGQAVRFKEEMIDSMTKAQLLVALNVVLTLKPDAISVIHGQMLGINNASELTIKDLSNAVKEASNTLYVGIPIMNVSDANPLLRGDLFRKEFDTFKNANSQELSDMKIIATQIREITLAELNAMPNAGEAFQGGDGLGGRQGTGEAVPLPRGGVPADGNQGSSNTLASPTPKNTTRKGKYIPPHLRTPTNTTVEPSGGGGAGNTVGSVHQPPVVSSRTGVRIQDVPLPGTGYATFVGSGRTFNKYRATTNGYEPVSDINADGVLIPSGRLGEANSRLKFFNLINKKSEMEQIRELRQSREHNLPRQPTETLTDVRGSGVARALNPIAKKKASKIIATKELNTQTMVELKATAESIGITKFPRSKKALIEKILAQQNE